MNRRSLFGYLGAALFGRLLPKPKAKPPADPPTSDWTIGLGDQPVCAGFDGLVHRCGLPSVQSRGVNEGPRAIGELLAYDPFETIASAARRQAEDAAFTYADWEDDDE